MPASEPVEGAFITSQVPLVHELLDGPQRCLKADKTPALKEALFLAPGLQGL